MKANHVLACMKRAFYDLSNDVFLKLYNEILRSMMEYGNISYMGTFCWIKKIGQSSASQYLIFLHCIEKKAKILEHRKALITGQDKLT